MQLNLLNIDSISILPSKYENRVQLKINGLDLEDLLNNYDILDVIKYYGVTELLDIIGKEKIIEHLNEHQVFSPTVNV